MKKCLKNVLKLCWIFREKEDGIFNFLYEKGMDHFWNDHCRCSALYKILIQMRNCYIQYNYLFNMRSYKKLYDIFNKPKWHPS